MGALRRLRGQEWRIAVLAGLVAGAIYAASRLGTSREAALLILEQWARSFGWSGPFVFVLAHATGTALLLPSSVFGAAAALLFGPWWGFLVAWLGAWLGGAGGYWAARWLGRDAVSRILGHRQFRLQASLRKNAFTKVFVLRAACLPYSPVSFALGLSGVPFGPYFWGTGLGLMFGTAAFTAGVAVARDLAVGRAPSMAGLGAFVMLVVAAAGIVGVVRRKRTEAVSGDD